MIVPLVVIDTNVLVSGLLSVDPQAMACQVLDSMLAGRFVYLLSPTLLDEYRNVLLRPKIQRVHGLNESEIDTLLTEIVTHAVWRDPPQTTAAPDPGDNHLWDLLNTTQGSVLVTGDQLLLQNPPEFASVIGLRSFLEMLTRG